jgi:hypothetical protein
MASEVAVTMDDPILTDTPLMSATERNAAILAVLDEMHVKAALFVCGKRVDSEEGKRLLQAWDEKGHWLASHTYSHESYNSRKQTFSTFSEDFLKNEPLISSYRGFHKLLRFPFLKEGDTPEKRDLMRALLARKGYQEGYVTIDASDWYIDERMSARLRRDPKADLSPYREYYLEHIWDRAQYYDRLARQSLGREIKHTLLVHHSLLNALFLKDVLKMFQEKGWRVIDASLAFKDPIFTKQPKIAPAGESIVWALAKESGKFDDQLRYPAEDGEYEKGKMDRLGL